MIQLRTHLAPRVLSRWLLALACLAAFAAPQTAQAVPITFATYNQDSAYNDVDFTQDGGGTSASLYTNTLGGTPVSFQFSNIASLPPALTGPVAAHMTMSFGTTIPVIVDGGHLTQFMESGSITFRRDSDNAILLQVTVSTGYPAIDGSIADTGVNLIGDQDLGDTVTFSSAFVNFTGSSSRSFSINLTSIVPPLGVTGDFLRNFTAASSGSFASDPPPSVPEPTSLALIGLGLIGAPVILRRRKAAE